MRVTGFWVPVSEGLLNSFLLLTIFGATFGVYCIQLMASVNTDFLNYF